jgi:hypothetical protein
MNRLVLALFALAIVSARAQLVPTDDSYVKDAVATNNGNSGVLNVKQGAAKTSTFVRFNLGSLPNGINGSSVAKATLRVFVTAANAAGSFDVYRVAGTWKESTITGTTQPALGTVITTGVVVALTN